jgi:hypothetical protein
MVYDDWLLQGPGGPEDPEPAPSEYEISQAEFHAITSQRWKYKVRRMAKRSTQRRRKNLDWYFRQRREDQNAQVCF